MKKIIFTLFASYCGALIFFAVLSIFSVSAVRTGMFRGEWVIGNTLVLFIRFLIPVHIAAILFAYSLFSEEPELNRKDGRLSFLRVVNYSLVLFLVLMFAYTVLLEGVMPAGLRMREQAVVKNGVAAELKKSAENALNHEKFSEARYYIEYYLTINPGDLVFREELEKVISREKAVAHELRDDDKGGIAEGTVLMHMTFQDFLEKARDRYDNEDYITAQYYADLAMKLDASHPEPKRIIAASRSKISRMPLSREEQDNILFFAQKREGYDMLSRNEWVAAYYHFQNLLTRHPSDPDLRKYIRTAYEGLKEVSFFRDEVALFSDLPIFDDIVFVNRAEGDEREFLYFKRMIQSYNPALDRLTRETSVETLLKQDEKTGIWQRILRLFRSEKPARPSGDSIINYYAVDIEGIRISKDGEIKYHFKAPYGKFLDGILVMRCLDRGDAEGEMLPEFFIGEAPDEAPYYIKIRSSPARIMQVALGKEGFDKANVRSLLSLAEIFPFFGLDNRGVYLAFFSRLFMLFSFVIFSFFAMGIGKRLRSKYLARPPVMCFFFFPVLPFLTSLIFEAYRYTGAIFSGLFLLSPGFSTAVILFLVLQGLLLIGSLLYVAKQVNR